MSEASIQIRGARVHNLRDVDLDVPLGKLVVLTGVSGSGKSTLAFDTIHAEGRRRYLEGLSSYARQFLDQLEPPDVDSIDGLPPTVAVDQKAGAANPRATVATLTELHDALRVLYARAGTPRCPDCGVEIRRQSPERIVAGLLALAEGTKVVILAPLVRGRKGEHAEAFEAIRRAGLIRARVDGVTVEIQEAPKLAKTKTHDVEAVVDRIVIREGVRPRLAESVDLALKLGDGGIVASVQEGADWVDRRMSVHYACPDCGRSVGEIEPRTFAFNTPHGACPDCGGLGRPRVFDPGLVLPDPSRSIEAGAVAPWETLKPAIRSTMEKDPTLDKFLKRKKKKRTTPLSEWSDADRAKLLEGDGDFPGLLAGLKTAFENGKPSTRTALDAFRLEIVCPSCGGSRLHRDARSVRFAGSTIDELCRRSITAAAEFFAKIEPDAEFRPVVDPLLAEIRPRLTFLERAGVGYLTLDRPVDGLSGGELQRVRLASRIGSGLVGVCHVLDEPTAGLHPADADRLIALLAELRDQGNTVLVVEHDESVIRASDWLIDLGPGAGSEGGLVVARGATADVIATGESATARRLRHGPPPSTGGSGRLERSPGRLVVRGATEHNLKNVTTSFPLGCLTSVTGVSGSGKSTLVGDVLARVARRRLWGGGDAPGAHESVEGLEAFDKLILVDQSPIGKGPRSTPATYTGVFDDLRRVYAATREAKIRGFGASRFAFNGPSGRCPTCLGLGVRKVEMGFLPEIQVRCEACGGARFNPPTLEIKYKGWSIGDALDARVDAAATHFENVPRVRRGLEALREAGLGYVALGQSAATLSGGESQRVKLAAELGKSETGRTLYLLDEPTTGLHFDDVARLLLLLHRLADLGNTLIVVEHNPDLIRAADWVVDLGPGGGEAGGRIVAEGTVQDLRRNSESLTGRWL